MGVKNYQPKPTIVSRAEWGAVPKLGIESCIRNINSYDYLVVHHCATTNTTVDSRTEKDQQWYIQDLHMRSKGWCDIGYHFGLGKNGTILEGADPVYEGRHEPTVNSNSLGIVVHGDYTTRTFTSNQETKLVDLLSWLCYRYNIEPDRIKGHRDFKATACPGNNLYNKLPQIRTAVWMKLYDGGSGV